MILDQNLDFEGQATIEGTNIVSQLLKNNYAGLICIRSGSVAEQDLMKYANAGAHCVFGKDMPVKEMILELKAAYVRHNHNGVMFGAAMRCACVLVCFVFLCVRVCCVCARRKPNQWAEPHRDR